eukprot:tig00020629_g12406.t1
MGRPTGAAAVRVSKRQIRRLVQESNACADDMLAAMNCWRKANFDPTACVEEERRLLQCASKMATHQKRLPPVNYLLRRGPDS